VVVSRESLDRLVRQFDGRPRLVFAAGDQQDRAVDALDLDGGPVQQFLGSALDGPERRRRRVATEGLVETLLLLVDVSVDRQVRHWLAVHRPRRPLLVDAVHPGRRGEGVRTRDVRDDGTHAVDVRPRQQCGLAATGEADGAHAVAVDGRSVGQPGRRASEVLQGDLRERVRGGGRVEVLDAERGVAVPGEAARVRPLVPATAAAPVEDQHAVVGTVAEARIEPPAQVIPVDVRGEREPSIVHT